MPNISAHTASETTDTKDRRNDVFAEVREWLWARYEERQGKGDNSYANVMADVIGLFTYHFIGFDEPYGKGDGPAFVEAMREKIRADALAEHGRAGAPLGRESPQSSAAAGDTPGGAVDG